MTAHTDSHNHGIVINKKQQQVVVAKSVCNSRKSNRTWRTTRVRSKSVLCSFADSSLKRCVYESDFLPPRCDSYLGGQNMN